MEQLCIYVLDVNERENDPIYIKIKNLIKGDSFNVCNTEVSKTTFGYYEISSDEEHIMYQNVQEVYHHILKVINDYMFQK